jgi:hypothetical protein
MATANPTNPNRLDPYRHFRPFFGLGDRDMSNQSCGNCAALQAENARLRARIARLEAALARAKKVIEYQKRQLDSARITCQWYIQKAKEAMSQHLPRGTWSLWKGRDEAARSVYGVIGQDFGIGMLAEIASLIGW